MTSPVPQGAVRFVSGMNGALVLDVDATGKVIQQVLDASSQTQLWRLIPVSGAADLYHIVRLGDNTLSLAATGDLVLGVVPLNSISPSHRWAFRRVSSEGIYTIENQQGSRVLSVTEMRKDPGADVIPFGNVNGQNQQWRLDSNVPPTVSVAPTSPNVTPTSPKLLVLSGSVVAEGATSGWVINQNDSTRGIKLPIKFAEKYNAPPLVIAALMAVSLDSRGTVSQFGVWWENVTTTGFDLNYWIGPNVVVTNMRAVWLAHGYTP